MLAKYAPPLVNKLGLKFPILSDPDNQYADQLGVVFSLDPQLVEIYKGWGIDLDRFNGSGGWRLPLPGRIIIDRDGRVLEVELHTDHTQRPEPAQTLALLQALPRSANGPS